MCPSEADTEQPCQRAQGNAQGEATLPRGRGDVQGDRGPSRLQTLRSSRDRSIEAIWQRLGLPPCPLCGEHPLPCPKPPRSQPGSANPRPSPCQHRQRLRRQTQRKARPELQPQRGNHRPTKLLPASWGVGVGAAHPSEGPPDPGLPISSDRAPATAHPPATRPRPRSEERAEK